SFTPAATPEQGRAMFELIAASAARIYAEEAVGTLGLGRFGADMRVQLCNEGPVTFWLQVSPGQTA
ncbi:MAG TPA: D-aminoacyl-tRNA deacylase, partial [Burkholderiales bacterium]|nr:D-aminoacyl-tRNA deacylase [Burkholderiales bacterium]